ncbi:MULTISPECIES: hypothetical protein [Alphaproteobacteria]|uniref:Uncharacterized protein n=2 Tax=Alphaproteobacteria TaxID=28211 RepID=A0A512HJI1_9HYPH|nr:MULTISPECIES: hypothetical protein [Alphaproteobacteria]GEO85560.1 hypothetical protein RNA01_24920 [Ciceribacter naphthalenivorans]GLR22085.1 hypothetical protein GCM10007920_18720 [Ciceribacter naphthalenivorans]GLT04941.1 hypothetical protein GCM10007926_18720 [Sphingomonas psychrolutea]
MMRLGKVIALLAFLFPLPVTATAEPLVQIQYHPDPCQEIAAIAEGETATVGKVTISLQPFYYAACERVREQIVDSIKARATVLRGDLETEFKVRASTLYDRFLTWLHDLVDKQAGPAGLTAEEREQFYRAWLQSPDQDLSIYVNAYMAEKMPDVQAALERYQKDSSREIVTGLQALWDEARKKLEALDAAYDDLKDAEPETKYTDILEKHGLSGEWIDRLGNYEAQFDLLDKSYGLLDTARVIHSAFTADTYAGRLEGMFSLMEKFGGYLSDSRVPGVSLLGTLVQSYGKIAKETLARANALKLLIRAREGYCVGLATHTLDDARGRAFKALVGDGIQACPLNENLPLLKDIYVQSEPEDLSQLYFWLDGAFIKGRENGGGASAVNKAQAFIRDAADIGFSDYVGKDADMATIASVYNTPYGPQDYLTDLPGHRAVPGLAGIISEGDAVIDAIGERIRALRTGLALDSFCDDAAFERLLDSEASLKLSAYPLDDTNQLGRLKVSYALGFIQQHREIAGGTATRTEAYRRYREIWERLKLLSVVRIEGQLLDESRKGGACDRCGMAPVTVRVSNGSEMTGCKVPNADAQGRFTARIVTRSTEVSIDPAATVGDITSKPAIIDARHLDLTGVRPPFVRQFSVNLFMPFVAGEDLTDALNVLRGLHGAVMEAAASGRIACSAGHMAYSELKTAAGTLANRITALEQEVDKRSPQLAALERAGERSRQLADEAQRAAQAVADAKQKAEAAALTACDRAAELRKETDEALQRRNLTEIRSAVTGAKLQARTATNEDRKAQDAASATEELVQTSLPTIEEIGAVPARIAAMASEKGGLQGTADDGTARRAALGEAVRSIEAIVPRAEAAHRAVLSLAAKAGTEDADTAIAETDRLLAEIHAAAGELAGCSEQLDKASAVAMSEGGLLAERLERLSQRIHPIGSRNGGPALIDALRSAASSARASADVSEIFAEATTAAAGDAARCLALGESALTTDRTDDNAAAAEAAIAQCRFEDARRLLEGMTGSPRYTELAASYQAAVDREGQTKADYDRAQALYQAGTIDAALDALRKARANTQCDNFRIAIDSATTKIEAGANDPLTSAIRAAIDSCDFTAARDGLATLSAAGHPLVAELRASYESAVDRETQTQALWDQARTLNGENKTTEAVAVLRSARSNTRCGAFASRIDRALAALGATQPGPPSDVTAVMNWEQPWSGTIKLTQLQINGATTSLPSAVQMLDRDWRRAKAQAERQSDGIKGIGTMLASPIGEAIVGAAKATLDVLDQGIPMGFALTAQEDGFRVVPVGEIDPGMQKNVDRIPLLKPEEERLLQASYTNPIGSLSLNVSMRAADTFDQVELQIELEGRRPPDDDAGSEIRTVKLTISGSLKPGWIPTSLLATEITTRFQSAMKRYASKPSNP